MRHSLFFICEIAYNTFMENQTKKRNTEPARTYLYTIREARVSEDTSDILKYSLYIPVPLFKELDRDADDLGKTVNQHILHILQLAYGHVRHEAYPKWAIVEGMYDRDEDGAR